MMQLDFLLIISYLFIFVQCNSLPNQSIPMDKNTVLLLFGTRHGNRNPEKFLTVNGKSWGFEGATELTSFGKRQGYGLGKELKSFMGEFVSNNYNASEVKYYSSSANRCQMTLQVVTTGIHEPDSFADWNTKQFDFWSPVPYTIDDPLLRLYSVKKCINSDKVWAPIDSDSLPSLRQQLDNNSALFTYLSNSTGWNFTSLSVAADLADNIIEMDLNNALYPNWLQNPTLPGYTTESLKKAILAFAESHQNACALDYSPCGDLMAGSWIYHISQLIQKSNNNTEGIPKLVGYASHTEITLSVMKLMGIEKEELTTSAGFVIEFRRRPTPSVRLLNHDPNPIDEHVIYKAILVDELKDKADQDGFIPIEAFLQYVQPKELSDWESACGIEKNDCSISIRRNLDVSIISSSSSLITFSLLLLFSSFFGTF